MISRVSSSNFNRNVNFRGDIGQSIKDVSNSVNDFWGDDNKKETEAVVGASAATATAVGATRVNKAVKVIKESKKLGVDLTKNAAKHEENLSNAAMNIGKAILKNPILSKIIEKTGKTLSKSPLLTKALKLSGKFIAKPLIAGASILLVGVDLIKSISTTKDMAENAAKNIA